MDLHLRHLIRSARDKHSHRLADDAFALVQACSSQFITDFSPELLVLFAEVASALRGRESNVLRALELYDRLRCEDDQFKVRALLVRCLYEARLGTDTFRLKGHHLLQQTKYALTFLMAALAIATRAGNDSRYGFLVCNASLVFWEVVRPVCRTGWQSHVVKETELILSALKAVAHSSGSSVTPGEKGKGGAGSLAAMLPAAVSPRWLIEMTLQLAFGYEDAGDASNAQKTVDTVNALLDDVIKPEPLVDPSDPRWQVRDLVWNARAHFARKTPDKTKQDINAASGSSLRGTALFVSNGGTPKEKCEDELIASWSTIDTGFDLREAAKCSNAQAPRREEGSSGTRKSLSPAKLMDLALATRAACAAGCHSLARAMLLRLEAFQTLTGRGMILLDLSRAEVDVWQSCRLEHKDPVSGLLLRLEDQRAVEVEGRRRAVRLCEQCCQAARRINDVSLVEESAVVLCNVGRELMSNKHRLQIYKSLQTCASILEEIQSTRLVRLRVQLGLEIASCEVAQDLPTKGIEELQRARSIDYTLAESDLSEDAQKRLSDQGLDPALHVRPFDEHINRQHHLLQLKLNLYKEPDDVSDQVTLLLDQVRRQKHSSSNAAATIDMLMQGFAKLETALDELCRDGLQASSNVVEKRLSVIRSNKALRPLACQAPAVVRVGGPSEPEVLAVRDQKPKGTREAATEKAKRLISMICEIGLEARKAGQPDLAIRACDRALAAVVGGPAALSSSAVVQFGPPPVEVEAALLLAKAAYTKALCLSTSLREVGAVNGVDDEIEVEEKKSGRSMQQRATTSSQKRELIQSLLFGMEKSCEFEQWWMVTNGLVHWWNLHLELVDLGRRQPQLFARTALQEYHSGLKEVQSYFYGSRRLPNDDLRHTLVANLVLARLEASVLVGQLGVLEVDQLLVLKRLRANERREVVARVTELCRANEKAPPDLSKLRPERLEAQAPAAAAPGGKSGASAKGAPPAPTLLAGEDRADLQGYEADVAMYTSSIPWAKDALEAQKSCADKAVELLNQWEPSDHDDDMLTLWVKLWTVLGRQCLGRPMNTSTGAKYALMCATKGLGRVDMPMPKHASQERLRWRGACHALCGEAFCALADPGRQESESLGSLRSMSLAQFQRCCDYALKTTNAALAVSGATHLWNVALPLLKSAETREALAGPLRAAVQALGAVQYREDTCFLVDMYSSLFECYGDGNQWNQVHEMLDEAFRAVPSSDSQSHRRLLALRMLALSRQGRNVAGAMGKMKASDAKAQARIWLVLAGASSKPLDQLNAYMQAIDVLRGSGSSEVVEARMQFADWLLRNGFGASHALEELGAAADVLLELEDGSEAEGEGAGEGISEASGSSSSDGSAVPARLGPAAAPSAVGVGGGRRRHRQRRGPERHFVGGDARRSDESSHHGRGLRPGANRLPSAQLNACHCEMLCRIFAARGRLGTGHDAHDDLLAASHFAERFFLSLVNTARDHSPEQVVPNVPTRLADWALEAAWPRCAGGSSPEVVSRAEGHPPLAFANPAVSFHTLVRLVDDLEEHGYHLWALPVLALHLHLGQVFEEQAPLRDGISCLAHLRLSRFASECGMPAAAAAAWSTGMEELQRMPGLLESLELEPEKAGHAAAIGAADPDAPHVCAPWFCKRLHGYEVWAEVGRECVLHGEVSMACKLVAEATSKAQGAGDRRAVRALLMTRARLSCLEGKPLDAVQALTQVTAADSRQTVDAALLLAGAYGSRHQHVRGEEVLRDTHVALKAKMAESVEGALDNELVLAECKLLHERLRRQLASLASRPSAPREWRSRLEAAFLLFAEMRERLCRGGFHRRCVAACGDFAEAVTRLLESRRLELARRPSTSEGSTRSETLPLETLATYARHLHSVLRACRPSREALLSLAVPAGEGAAGGGGALAPAEAAAARMSLCKAVSAALCRDFGVRQTGGGAGLDVDAAGGNCVEAWLRDVGGHLAVAEQVHSMARPASEVETSVALVSSASAALLGAAAEGCPALQRTDKLHAAAAGVLAELGRLQLELAAQQSPQEYESKWWGIGAVDACELQGMRAAERCSNVLHSRAPAHTCEISREQPSNADATGEQVPAAAAPSTGTPFDPLGKFTLHRAVTTSLEARDFAAAARALRVLALDAYGNASAGATFDALVLMQSTEVCARAEELLLGVLPEDHHERVQMRMLRGLERSWSYPRSLGAYQDVMRWLQLESPLFQRHQLNKLPSVRRLLLSHLPPRTLVVTLQLHERYLVVGAACSPPEGDYQHRLQQVTHFAMRREVADLELDGCLRGMQELDVQLEKGLISSLELDNALTERHGQILSYIDARVVEPIAQELAGHFWPHSCHLEHANNPKHLLLLPDEKLWGLPLERFPSFLSLFGRSTHSALSRDLSLHVAAQRVHRFVEAPEGEPGPLKTPLVVMKPSATVLLTDAFNEDFVSTTAENVKSETMCAVHERLVRDKVVGNEDLSLHGKTRAASQEDIMCMLADSSAFCSVGFARFFATIRAGHFASQDLRHVALVALFHRAINDASFRRQTKTNSMKTQAELAADTQFGTSIIASFRGVLCSVLTLVPVPVPLSLRCFEAFAREVRDGKTLAKAMERLLNLATTNPESRSMRSREGGLWPGDPSPPAADAKGRPDSRVSADPSVLQDLLPKHTRGAHILVGVPWLSAEAAESGGKKR